MPPRSMRAAVCGSPGAIDVRRMPRADPGPDEVRVRVGACGICGSDLHLFDSGLFARDRIPGHEFAGWVDALGARVSGFASGDSVAVEPFRSCGRCAACRAGRDPICAESRLLGVHEDGGLAEYVTVPARRLFRVPSDLSPPLAALAEPMAVAVHGLRRGHFEAGQRVLVLGAGSVGLLAVAAARALGAGDVWSTARYAHQAQRALSLGAGRVLVEEEARPECLASVARETSFDLVVETVGGRADTLNAAAAAVRPGGTVSVLGVFLGPLELDPLAPLLKEVTFAWSYCYARGQGSSDFERAIELVGAERERLERLVTHALPLEEVQQAFALAASRQAGAVKVSVIP